MSDAFVDARAFGALAGAALTLCACGYDYPDRQAALDREPALVSDASCRVGEPAEGVRSARLQEITASPEAFAKTAVKVRGTLKSESDGKDRLVTQDGELRLDLAALPPFWIETCPNHVVDVEGTFTVARSGADKPVLHALAMSSVTP